MENNNKPDGGQELFYREIKFDRAALNEEKREITLSFSSEAEEVQRWFGIEILDHSSKSVRMNRIREVGSFIFNHDRNRIIGPIHEVNIENSRGVARVGFDDTDEGELAFKRTRSGSLKGTSFGYRVFSFKELRDGEEHTLSNGKVIKGRRDIPIMIAMDWEPTEITATPLPFDTSIGLGRCLTRSLYGIEIKRSQPKQEECTVTPEEIQKLIKDEIRSAIPDAIKEGIKGAVPEIRTMLADENKPKIRLEADVFARCIDQASAVSPDCEAKVTRMILNGKLEPEVQRFIIDSALGKGDANDPGGDGGDGTKRGTKGQGGKEQIRSFSQVKADDDFVEAFRDMDEFPLIQ